MEQAKRPMARSEPRGSVFLKRRNRLYGTCTGNCCGCISQARRSAKAMPMRSISRISAALINRYTGAEPTATGIKKVPLTAANQTQSSLRTPLEERQGGTAQPQQGQSRRLRHRRNLNTELLVFADEERCAGGERHIPLQRPSDLSGPNRTRPKWRTESDRAAAVQFGQSSAQRSHLTVVRTGGGRSEEHTSELPVT